jgi:YgiT-type zinc finger domain-containing protein
MTSKCPLCGGKRTTGSTTVTVELGVGVVVVRHVPAQVCDQCGETWLSDPVAAQLEEIVAQARAKQSIVDVTEWRSRAA